MVDVVVIGPVACDVNTVAGVAHPPQPGRAAHCATMVHRALGLSCAVVTRVAPGDRALLEPLAAAGVTLIVRPGAVTTTFHNDYDPDDPDRRVQRVDATAATLGVADLPDVQARVWQLGPLTETCIDPAVIGHCRRRGGLVGMDLQGLTRRVVNGRVEAAPPGRAMDQLRHLDVLKADDDELLSYTGERDLDAAAARLRGAGVAEILVTRASLGATLHGPEGPVAIDALPPGRTVDSTGCGDTFLAAYLARRIILPGRPAPGGPPGRVPGDARRLGECGTFAAAAASLNIEELGVFQGDLAAILARQAGRDRPAPDADPVRLQHPAGRGPPSTTR